MTDREMLELAAKAAGLNYRDDLWNAGHVHNGQGLWAQWNPLADDGDTLRLLAARELHVSWEYMPGHVLVEDTASDHHACVRIINGDRASALRRAATACMAEIGRAMT